MPGWERHFCHPAPQLACRRKDQSRIKGRPLVHLCARDVRSWGALATWTQWATAHSSDSLRPPPLQTTVQTSRIALGCFSYSSYNKRFSVGNTTIYLSFSKSEASKAKELLRVSDIPDSQISLYIKWTTHCQLKINWPYIELTVV